VARYILFYKPYGVLSQFTPAPSSAHGTLKDYLDIPGIYPAGRLDHDSEGLLLLTDDGALQHQLTAPRFGHPRTYWVQVEGVPGEEALERLRRGVEIQGVRTKPAEARMLDGAPDLPARKPPIRYRKSVPARWLEMTLREGRNRQVRRMAAAVGHPALRLVRCAIGELGIGGMRPGEWRELRWEEVRFGERRGARRD